MNWPYKELESFFSLMGSCMVPYTERLKIRRIIGDGTGARLKAQRLQMFMFTLYSTVGGLCNLLYLDTCFRHRVCAQHGVGVLAVVSEMNVQVIRLGVYPEERNGLGCRVHGPWQKRKVHWGKVEVTITIYGPNQHECI
jgi:hypothetical protein